MQAFAGTAERSESRLRRALAGIARTPPFAALIALGFAVAAVPLSTAFVLTSLELDRLAQHGQEAVYRAVRATQDARHLVEQAAALERTARQFVVLRDADRLPAYTGLRDEFHARLRLQMDRGPQDERRYDRISALAALERAAYGLLRQAGPGAEAGRRAALERLVTLVADTRTLLAESNRDAEREAGVLRAMGERAQHGLLMRAFALAPFAIVLASIFFVLISRPVRQIDVAIRRLGDGELASPVRVTGPRDLEELGRRLDWLRTRLAEVEAQKRRFLRHVSHELKTPLATVREGAELLAGEVVGPLNAQQAEIAAILQDSSVRLQTLIEALLAYSRLDARAGPPAAHEPVALDDLVRATISDHVLSLRRRRIEVDSELARLTVPGDRWKLRTIVDNLLSNALKYAPEGGRITLRLRAAGGAAELDVLDTGPGVEAAERARVFEAFYQSPRQPPGPVRGTGLGLSIARECALAHGGDLEVLDAPLGGAHFRLRLPGVAHAPQDGSARATEGLAA